MTSFSGPKGLKWTDHRTCGFITTNERVKIDHNVSSDFTNQAPLSQLQQKNRKSEQMSTETDRGDEFWPHRRNTAVKRQRRFWFYLVQLRLILSENMGKDV